MKGGGGVPPTAHTPTPPHPPFAATARLSLFLVSGLFLFSSASQRGARLQSRERDGLLFIFREGGTKDMKARPADMHARTQQVCIHTHAHMHSSSYPACLLEFLKSWVLRLLASTSADLC